MQTSRGKPQTPSVHNRRIYAWALDGYRLRHQWLTRLDFHASYPVPVRWLAPLIHASFRPCLTATPLRFSSLRLHQASRGTFTLQVLGHARHTTTVEIFPTENFLIFFIRISYLVLSFLYNLARIRFSFFSVPSLYAFNGRPQFIHTGKFLKLPPPPYLLNFLSVLRSQFKL